MDSLYDEIKATEALEAIRKEKQDTKGRHTQVSTFVKGRNWEQEIEFHKYDNPSCWRTTWRSEDDSREELILHTQGIITDMKLPPIRGAYTAKKAQHMRQTVTIGGLGCASFTCDIDALLEIYAVMARHFPGMTGVSSSGSQDRPTIEAGNRLFIRKTDAQSIQEAEIDSQIDATGMMRDVVRGGIFIYSEDNVVHYGEERTEGDGSKKIYTNCYWTNWLKARAIGQARPANVQMRLKRRAEFDSDEEEDHTRKRMNEMMID
ncbi:hypothetical protein F5877DRAFT_68563 [Lentinula edodes]|nr:hypothetical protein F5877DRAFT_68563 [Lentinula edodes]